MEGHPAAQSNGAISHYATTGANTAAMAITGARDSLCLAVGACAGRCRTVLPPLVVPSFTSPSLPWSHLENRHSTGNITRTQRCLLYTSPSPRDGLLSR